MKVKIITASLLLLLIIEGCSSIIYAIRGPKYKGRFDIITYPKELDSTAFYYSKIYRKEEQKYFYNYVKYQNNGSFLGYASSELLTNKELETLKCKENYFIVKNGYLRWEVYYDSYNGYNLFKARVYGDSIIEWQVGSKRATQETYYKLKQ